METHHQFNYLHLTMCEIRTHWTTYFKPETDMDWPDVAICIYLLENTTSRLRIELFWLPKPPRQRQWIRHLEAAGARHLHGLLLHRTATTITVTMQSSTLFHSSCSWKCYIHIKPLKWVPLSLNTRARQVQTGFSLCALCSMSVWRRGDACQHMLAVMLPHTHTHFSFTITYVALTTVWKGMCVCVWEYDIRYGLSL